MKKLGLLLLFLVSLLVSCGSKEETYFREYVMNPIPRSVQILEVMDREGFGREVYVRFRMPESDLKEFLKLKSYEEMSPTSSSPWKSKDWYPIDWWVINPSDVCYRQKTNQIRPVSYLIKKENNEVWFLYYNH